MSLTGRYVIDRIKVVLLNRFKLPCPPYSEPQYWDAAYNSFGPNDFYEWGDVSLSDVKEYNYHQIEWDAQQSSSYPSKISSQSTLATTLNVDHNDEDDDIRTQKNQKQLRPILMLGCGNSKLGEEMIEQGGFKGPIIQVDVSRSVVENMRQRCSDLVSNGSMSFVQDDATELSAFRNNMIDACLDKGLMDAIFCAEDYHQLYQIQHTIHRVLRPGGTFVFFSFSRPEFLIPKLMMPSVSMNVQKRIPWTGIEVQQLSKILLYKMRKTDDNVKLIRSKTNRKQTRGRKMKF
mmetsp:Transcript_45412/g.50910  ORF Transcript_45412/g.50910 Transcript_45412/m.50910 type:complete len:290 (-) Transcript_45412:72-941(-)